MSVFYRFKSHLVQLCNNYTALGIDDIGKVYVGQGGTPSSGLMHYCNDDWNMWHQHKHRIYGWQSAECSYILMTACIAVTDPNTSSV